MSVVLCCAVLVDPPTRALLCPDLPCHHTTTITTTPWFTGPPRTATRTRNRIGSVYSKSGVAVRGLYLPATRAEGWLAVTLMATPSTVHLITEKKSFFRWYKVRVLKVSVI
ncbi:hypothetical protein E2C01_055612 [Portunus trituberculatus]|uniref:Uncharacterized protein n=1 Tax=Portunus trituberculatus TaxID=210409 RepID=A0A5B7GVH1_PORTR|nr:hypothetical protein [Portunus trituberculatus]